MKIFSFKSADHTTYFKSKKIKLMKQIGHARAHLEYYFESLVCEKLIWSSEIDDSAFDFPL